MAARRNEALLFAALLAASPAVGQIRTAPVVVPVPGAAAGVAIVGVAASLRPLSALPSAPQLGLPHSVLPSPSSPLASLTQSARVEAALRPTLPSALPAALPSGGAVETLSAPSSPANEAKPSRGDERQKVVLDDIAAANGWKAGKPDAALASLSRRDRPVDAAKIGAQLNSLFDGANARPGAGAVSVETLDPAPPTKGSVAGPALLAEVRSHTRQGHRAISYDEAKSLLFSKADSVVERGVRGVRDAYSGVFVPGTSDHGGDYGERGDADGDGYHETKGMNVEHLWPQSYFSEKLPMRGDLHHLMATFQHPNGMRGRLPFDEVPDNAVEYHNNAGARMGAGLFEPPDSAKGRVARSMLYFMARYGDQGVLPGNVVNHFWNARIQTLLRWNREFPPTEFERQRNSVVEKIQGNRNPFVDDPSLAERVGVEGFRMDGGRKSLARSVSGSGTQTQGRGSNNSHSERASDRHNNKGRRNHRNNRRW